MSISQPMNWLAVLPYFSVVLHDLKAMTSLERFSEIYFIRNSSTISVRHEVKLIVSCSQSSSLI